MNNTLGIILIWCLILLWCIFALMTFMIYDIRERKRRKEKAKRDAYMAQKQKEHRQRVKENK